MAYIRSIQQLQELTSHDKPPPVYVFIGVEEQHSDQAEQKGDGATVPAR